MKRIARSLVPTTLRQAIGSYLRSHVSTAIVELNRQLAAATQQVAESNRRVLEANSHMAAAVARADSLVVEREAILAHFKERLGYDSYPSLPIQRPALSAASRTMDGAQRTKFLIISNHRSGSTWLVTMLGALDDAATDYEFKWEINYSPLEVHKVLTESSPTVSETLDLFDGRASVVGSKLVFDPAPYSRRQLEAMPRKIGPDVRIVHLVRRYKDIFVSRRRGMLHNLRKGRAAAVGKFLRSELGAQDPTQFERLPDPIVVDPAAAYEELSNYLMNDLHIARFSKKMNYMCVDYDALSEQFPNVAAFVGSAASASEVSRTIKNSPTEKLPPAPPERLIANLAEIEPLFDTFEELRCRLLRSAT
jgi:hypothetical protein